MRPPLHGMVAIVAAACLSAAPAGAEDAAVDDARAGRPHAAYVEILGKNGVYGLGYDYALTDRLAVGGAAAYFWVESARVLSVSPYVNGYPVAGSWGALVLQGGLQLVHVDVPSRVAGWSGASATGVAGQVSAGFEHRSAFLCRVLLSGVFGAGGLRPWAGVGLGAAF